MLVTNNSEGQLSDVIDDLPLPYFDHTLALDAGSSDGTIDLLRSRKIQVMETGDVLGSILDGGGDANVVVYPVDGKNDVRDIVRLLLPLGRGTDMTIASRFLQGSERHDQSRRFRYRSTGNRVFTLVANLLFFGNATDTLTPFRGYKRSFLQRIAPSETGIGASYQVAIRAMRAGGVIEEIPTVENVPSEVHDRWRAVWSGVPLSLVLLREWVAGKTKR